MTKLIIQETIGQVVEIMRRVTTLTIAPFDTGAGSILQSLITGKGQLPVSSAAGVVGALGAPSAGQNLTGAPDSPYGMAWQDAEGGVVDPSVCGLRLTLTSGTPVTTADVTGATTIYFTPLLSGVIALYSSGGAWNRRYTAEISIKTTDQQAGTTVNGSPIITAIGDTSQFVVGMEVTGTGIAANSTISSIDSASQVTLNNNATASGTVTLTFKLPASKVYDVFCYETAALAPKLEFGPAWTDATTRATGLTKQDGITVKSGDPTRRWVGTIRTTATAGQCEDSVAKRLVWNTYNRKPRPMVVNDSTDLWTHNTPSTWRQARATATNQLDTVVGQAEDEAVVRVGVRGKSSTTSTYGVGIGVDKTNANDASVGNGGYSPVEESIWAEYPGIPTAGSTETVWA